ncbi:MULTISPECIES: gamma carbonic anhydrase family protein [Roseivirga]|jgi:carbonic anhydrase/acetyltransferase-like protein (isoleucine patch superfamily)|uniref:Gamma carbonic anhydrase family protein n=1 Tax=Roseivirga thermotolerans TaxID=1758176 RepID=A0ABQ3I9L9_9BACT|nr:MULTISPECIES: gamma carbonic anhydrase family protein [Roseivirga]MEC7753429.1 gamma carbonic anhydrase family protein [Bacteroidota bacterium]GHE63231.1 gamma carbonic anhydrase family protein [Roseivirga thermotolerans]|tara:strand:+ start:1361 stop:1873 length:513 start_codon:yes stop_codon:yes gene_type:complete
MALIKGVKGKRPEIDNSCWMADNATVVGDVKMAAHCNVWFNAVIRGDVCSVEMGENCNVQDGAVIHGTLNLSKTVMGKNVSIGHNAIVHGCTIEDNVLIGMGAIVMDNAVIKSGAMVAAGAVVLANTVVEANSVYAGTPAKKVKEVDERLRKVIENTPENYKMYTTWIED